MGEGGPQFEALQDRGQNVFTGLEVFDLASTVTYVTMESDEFTALCPITGQPDFYTVTITMDTRQGIESKSLKLYLVEYRSQGAFCEALAAQILKDVLAATEAEYAKVTIVQKPRGGIKITAAAEGWANFERREDASNVQQGVLGSAPPAQ